MASTFHGLLNCERFGFIARDLYEDVSDEWRPEFDRDDQRAELSLSYISPGGFSVGLLQGFRHYDFQNQSGGDTCNYTNVGLQYLLPNRYARLSIAARNIFDNNFNWVTDQFTFQGVIPARNVAASFQVNF